MSRFIAVAGHASRVRFYGHLLQWVPEGPNGERSFYIAVAPAKNWQYAELVRRRTTSRSSPAHEVRESPLVDIGPDDAAALADDWQLRLPTSEEWERAARAGALGDTVTCWEWTSTPAPKAGYIVRGGSYRDRPEDAPSLDNVSFEREAAEDVGVRFAADAGATGPLEAGASARPAGPAGAECAAILLPEPEGRAPLRRPMPRAVRWRSGSVVRFDNDQAMLLDPSGAALPATVRELSLARQVLAEGVIGRGQGRRVVAWRDDSEFVVYLTHEIEPGPSLSHVLRVIAADAALPAGSIAAAIGLHLALAWAGLELGERVIPIPEGGVLQPTPDEVFVGYGGRLLACPEVSQWSKTLGASAAQIAWGPPERELSERSCAYSIAAIVFAVLTRVAPRFTEAEVARRKMSVSDLLVWLASSEAKAGAPRPRLGDYRPDVAPRLIETVDAALDLDPRARPPVGELAAELGRLAAPEAAVDLLRRAAGRVDATTRDHELACWRAAAALAPRMASDGTDRHASGVEWPALADALDALEEALPATIDFY